MFFFSALFKRHDAAMKSRCEDEGETRGLPKYWKTLKSCFGHGFEFGSPSRNEYQRARDPATGFEGEEVYGIQAEYLDKEDMAWGKPKKSKKRSTTRSQIV